MAKPDTRNAHIRKGSKREKPERAKSAEADDAQRLLDDPAFVRAYDAIHEGLVNELQTLKHDGQAETDDYEREICRALRLLPGFKRALVLAVQGQKLRLADYRPSGPEKV